MTMVSVEMKVALSLVVLTTIHVTSVVAEDLLSSGLNVCGDCDYRTPFYFCCAGWTNGTNDGPNCLTPLCQTMCSEHGLCTSPNVCTCFPGYIGEVCNTESQNPHDARLLHGKEPHQGLLQVRSQNDEWSFIHPENWSRNNSHVLCQQLGYSFALVQSDGDWSDFPDNSYPSLQLQFRCVGNEDALRDCEVLRVQGEAAERQMVAIECYDPSPDQTNTCGLTCDQETVSRTGCKCDPLCESYGDCCPDYSTNGNCPSKIAINTEETCTPMPLHHRPSFDIPNAVAIGYFIISDCGYSWFWTDDISRLCRNKPNASDPLTFTPVQERNISEISVRKIYRNIFCGICNFRDVHELQAWNILVVEETIREMSPEIYNIVPPSGDTAPRTCLLNLESASTCLYHHNSVEDGCKNYYAPRFIQNDGFVNVFCAVCRDEYPQYHEYKIFNEQVNLPVKRDEPNPYCGPLKGRPPPRPRPTRSRPEVQYPDLLILFDFGGGIMNSGCEEGELYDYFSQSCRLLSCPSDFMLANGRCERIVAAARPPLTSPPRRIPISAYDQVLQDCVYSMLNKENTSKNIIDPRYTINITASSEIVVFHVNSTSLVSNVIILNNIIVSWQKSSMKEKFCNASSILLVLEDNTINAVSNETYIACIHSKQVAGCVSTDSFDLINTTKTARLIEYTWENETDCYVIKVTRDDCEAFNPPIHHCAEIELASDEFEILLTPDNTTTVLHKASGMALSDDEFSIGDNGTVRVCVSVFDPDPEKLSRFEEALTYVSFGCLILSLAATFLTFLSYCVFRELRNLTGYIVINLLIAFFVAQLMFLLSPRLLKPTELCLSSAIINHFAWLAGFFWMNALSFVTTNTLSRSTMVRDKSMEACRLIRYMSYAWGGPLVIVGVCTSLHFCNCTEIAPIYGEKNGALCWLIGHDDYANLWGFTAPVFVLLLFNVALFIYAVATFRKKMASTKSNITSKRLKMEISIYIKLTILMGLPWLLGFVLTFKTNIYLNYIYTVLNSLQGVFIFWALVLTGRAGKLWRHKLCRSQRTLEQTGRFSKPGANSTVKTTTTSFTTSSISKVDTSNNEYN